MVLIGLHALSGGDIIWFIVRKRQDIMLAGISNARDPIQEAFCYLHPVFLKSSVTDAPEEYVSKLYQPDADIVWLTEWRWWMFWEKKKLNGVTYHLQELRFSKVSNVYIINSSFGNPHLTLILINQCLTIMVGSGTVINIFLSPNLEAPLQLIKCGCNKSVCAQLGVSAQLTIYMVRICIEDPCKNIASEQCLLNFYFHVDSDIS